MYIYKHVNICACERNGLCCYESYFGAWLSLYRQVINADKMNEGMNMYMNTSMKYL